MKLKSIFNITLLGTILCLWCSSLYAQIDVNRVMTIGRNALYFKDYVVSIGYFNQVIGSRPWMAEPYFYRAVAKVSLDDFSGAEADASKCIERNPFIPKAYLVRGVAKQNRKDYAAAVEDYRKGLRLTPDDEAMRYNLATTEMLLDNFDKAQHELEQMLIYSPGSKDAYLLMSAVSLQQKDTVKAQQCIDKVLKRDSLFGPAYAIRSHIAYQQQKYDLSHKLISKAISLDDSDPSLYINRGIIRYQLNNLRGAMDDYSHVIDVDPKNKVALFNRALLRSYVGETNNAIADFDRLLKITPNNYMAKFNRGILLAQIGQHRQAIKDFNDVLQKYPQFTDGLLARSASRKATGDAVGADRDYWRVVDLQEAAKRKKASKKANGNSQAKETRKEDDEEIDKFNLMVESEPSQNVKAEYSSKIRGRVQDQDVEVEPRPIFALTYYHVFDADDVQQKTNYAELIEKINKQGILPFKLVISNRTTSLNEEMVQRHQKDIQDISAESNNNANMLFRRGLNYLLLQNHEQALQDFGKSLALNPKQPLVLFARAICTYKKQEAEKNRISDVAKNDQLSTSEQIIRGESRKNALGKKTDNIPPTPNSLNDKILNIDNPVKDLTAAIALAPKFAYAYYNRALIYAEQGDKKGAIKDYTMAIELQPTMADAYFNRGLLLLSEGKIAEGTKDLSKAGELGIYQAYNIIKRMNK